MIFRSHAVPSLFRSQKVRPFAMFLPCFSHSSRDQLEVTLTKKSPADWPELGGKATLTSTGTTPAAPPNTAAVNAAVSSSTGSDTTVKEKPTQVARPYASTKDWDVVSQGYVSRVLGRYFPRLSGLTDRTSRTETLV